eukprot:scaffold9409_cov116-Isochrysis_galbana.AAC.20
MPGMVARRLILQTHPSIDRNRQKKCTKSALPFPSHVDQFIYISFTGTTSQSNSTCCLPCVGPDTSRRANSGRLVRPGSAPGNWRDAAAVRRDSSERLAPETLAARPAMTAATMPAKTMAASVMRTAKPKKIACSFAGATVGFRLAGSMEISRPMPRIHLETRPGESQAAALPEKGIPGGGGDGPGELGGG